MANKSNFQSQLAQLEAIVDWFEKEDVDLDEAITKFENGIKLANDLKKYLEDVENKVEQIKLRFEPKTTKPEAQS